MKAKHLAPREGRRWRRRSKVFAATMGAIFAGAGGFAAASNWTVGLGAGSSGEGQSATVTNITITAVASPAATNLLYPGGNGDVVAIISNPNPFPVTITAIQLPTNTTYAVGYTNSNLSTPNASCTGTTSLVSWNYATGTSGSSHTLTSALTVGPYASGADGTLTVTFTNDASMASTSPSGCENTYFSMPSMTGVTATGGAATSTTSPATDAWTS